MKRGGTEEEREMGMRRRRGERREEERGERRAPRPECKLF